MTHSQQTNVSRRFRRFVKRYEQIHAISINKALKEQIKQYTDTGTLIAVNSAPLYGALVSLYKDSARIWAHQSHIQTRQAVRDSRTNKGRQPIGFSERIVELMRQYYGIDLLNIAEGLTQTTKDTISAVLSEAAEQGWSFDEIVSRLQLPELTAARARLIARTEVVSSANGAATINAKESGLELNKIWIATLDDRTRPDHMVVNGQTVGLHDNFNVGGSVMSQPGDRTQGAGADEICNCRCTVAFIPIN